MRKLFQRVLTLALVALIIPSCGNPAKMAKNADLVKVSCDPQVLEVVAGKIDAKVTVEFPEGYFHPKAILEAIPVLVYEGGEVALDPVMLQGEKITDNYTVVPESGAQISKNFTFNYVKGMEKSHLELRMTVLHKEKRIAFPEPYKLADGANTTYMLVSKGGALAFAPDAYQAVIPEKGEAQILYQINSSVVRPNQLKSDEIKAFKEFLANIKADERREIKNTEIVAYASPDGGVKLNTKLSSNRAETAEKAFNKSINDKKVAIDSPVESKSISQDWDGFKDLVQNSNLDDKDLIVRVLEMYSDPAVREREIKNMSQVYTTLAKDVLPKLRRARFIANIEFTNYSDQELVALVNDNIEILDEEALLHAASLVKDNDVKSTVYTKAIDKFSSNRAMVNLAVTMLKGNKTNEAKDALANVSEKDTYYYNTLGVIALREGNKEEAAAAFAKSNLKEAAYNQAILDICNGKYDSAYAKLAGSGDHNEGLAAILVNKLDAAKSALQSHNCPRGSYLKAIVAARQGNVQEAKAALENAKKAETFAKRAEKDIEFAKL